MSRNCEAIHAPTPQRIQRAKKEGKFVRSRDLVWAGIWISCVSSIAWFGPILIEKWKHWVTDLWSAGLHNNPTDIQDFEPMQAIGSMLIGLLPILVLILAGTIVFNLVQGGWGIFPDRIRPQWSRLSRERRGFSIESIMQSAATVLKIASLLIVCGLFLYWRRDEWMRLGAENLEATFESSSAFFMAFALQVAIVLGCFGLIDYGLARFEYTRGLMMSDQELRDEQRQLAGDPTVQSARSVIYRERVNQPQISEWADVDGLVVDGRANVFAVSWSDDSREQGSILWSLSGSQAVMAIGAAGSRNVDIHRNVELATLLSSLKPGDQFSTKNEA